MKQFPKSLQLKLQQREQNSALRKLPLSNNLIDFSSNDYLGFAKSETIFNQTHQYLIDNNIKANGATGSRLLSGNHNLYQITEDYIANFHQSETALIFNSGYDANVGFFSSVPQRNDIILFDELCHASIRDGIQMSTAKSYKFQHNNFEELEKLLIKLNPILKTNSQTEPVEVFSNEIYLVTESVFSMDGDAPNLEELINLCEKYNCNLVIDEAHALGVYGNSGEGLLQSLGLQDKVFARIITFGKGLGCHGAAILGSNQLKNYLVNFARSFIYTTGLSPHSVATILMAYQHLKEKKETLQQLRNNIQFFNQQKLQFGLKPLFVYSKSAIQSAIIPGNEKVKTIASQLQENGFDVKPILSPTVPEGQERLRFCLHSYNSEKEITDVLQLLSTFVF
ncbi:pyridoxal phosphate-dependent aminotransferase family protein [Flavobacterium sp. SUN052]|uniref:aminotransferase class I/II-fold pyridoxal phosphate-dependent enzyme n=1 Tax=Flavobacterium sp. SUN052 TaxID=3002441 RepID=UPI00237DA067|nr:pyridoxal phosphate-dependent aminotransferase family protein [Flavobacterium sp. SUN052]MEC4003315.1 pyridoxal phosphate-dependent aminotransferase family protein [Flavobacterium sp. SUN052]